MEIANSGANLVSDRKGVFSRNLGCALADFYGYYSSWDLHVDAESAMAYVRRIGGGVRLRHIDIRSDWMNLLRSREDVDFASIPGTKNPADAHTQIFSRNKFKEAVAERMGRLPKCLCRLREPGDNMSTVQNSDERADAAAEHTKQYTKDSIVKY